MRISRALAIITIACGMSWAQAGLADDVGAAAVAVGGERPVVEKLLDIMLKSGQISRGQHDELLEQSRQEQMAAAAAVADAAERAMPAASSGPTDWNFKWSNGFKLDRNDGAFKLKFGGRIMNDWAVVRNNGSLDDELGGKGTGTEFRRARLFFQGTVYERLFFKAQYDFANTGDGEADFKDMYVGLKGIGPIGDVRVGHFKEPFSVEELTSSKYITFMERALPTLAFSPSRNTGIGFQGNLAEKHVLWQVGGFRDTNDSGFGFDDDDRYNITTRLVGVPIYQNEGERVLHVESGYSHQFAKGSVESGYEVRPEAHLAKKLIDTGVIMVHDVDLLNVGLAGVWGPLSAQGEYTRAFVDGSDPGVGSPEFWGAYGQLSYFLTGEHRNYELGKGAFGRVKLNSPFDLGEGDWGAFEVAARFSYLDASDDGIKGGEMWDVTGGLNWYLFPNFRIMANYVYADLDDRDTDDVVDLDGLNHIGQVRFQIDF